jgi:hypothetical protein
MNLSIEMIIVVMVMASSMLQNSTKIGKQNNKKENGDLNNLVLTNPNLGQL